MYVPFLQWVARVTLKFPGMYVNRKKSHILLVKKIATEPIHCFLLALAMSEHIYVYVYIYVHSKNQRNYLWTFLAKNLAGSPRKKPLTQSIQS